MLFPVGYCGGKCRPPPPNIFNAEPETISIAEKVPLTCSRSCKISWDEGWSIDYIDSPYCIPLETTLNKQLDPYNTPNRIGKDLEASQSTAIDPSYHSTSKSILAVKYRSMDLLSL